MTATRWCARTRCSRTKSVAPSRPAGAELPSCTTEAFHRKTADHIPAVLRLALLPPAEAIAELTARIAAAGRDIEALCETHPETAAPRQVTAVGPHHRAHVRAHDRGSRPLPEEPGGRRLPRARAEAARLGEARTATRHQQERRPGLETAARAARALHPRSVRPRYRSAPLGWTARGHAGTRARERAAVARRLSVLLLALWKRGEVFEPLGHAIARDAALRAAATTRAARDRWKRRPRAAAKRRAVLGPEATRSCPGRFRSRAIGPRGRRA